MVNPLECPWALPLSLGIGVVVLGCGAEERRGRAGWSAAVDTLGDTIVVHTTSGSVWGDTTTLVEEIRIGVWEGADEYMLGSVNAIAVAADGAIYAMDSHVPALRKYGSDGGYLTTFGREGGGPGEYARPDGGLAVLPDGRVVLRDPGNGRFNVYSPDGDPLDGWPLAGGFSTSRRLYTDRAGNVYTLVLLERGLVPWEWTYGLARYSGDGNQPDTVPAPVWDFERQVVTGQREGSSSSRRVPFTASPSWTFSPLGYMVGGLSTEYRIELYHADGRILRIERDWVPVPVAGEEAEERRREIEENFSQRFQGWRWNGPPIPRTKPPFENLFAGEDGTIWVRVSTAGRAGVPADEAREEERRTGRPQIRYRSPVAFDVFASDGRFLGHVKAPDEFAASPEPVFRGDYVWATVRDELDVTSIVRYRMVRPTDGT